MIIFYEQKVKHDEQVIMKRTKYHLYEQKVKHDEQIIMQRIKYYISQTLQTKKS